jgi:hypothetical protein
MAAKPPAGGAARLLFLRKVTYTARSCSVCACSGESQPKFYSKAIEAFGPNEFENSPRMLKRFLTTIENRSVTSGWDAVLDIFTSILLTQYEKIS